VRQVNNNLSQPRLLPFPQPKFTPSAMASTDGDDPIAAQLASRSLTPIAQLNPDLPDQSTRAVRGQVTLTWPFNSVTKTVAFLLSEPDVRLRRNKGQVRVEFSGPCARAVAELGVGAFDEVVIGLEGAEWDEDRSLKRPLESRVGWQVGFRRRVVLQVCYLTYEHSLSLYSVLRADTAIGHLRRVGGEALSQHRPFRGRGHSRATANE
jgi:hypothetical protein